MIRMQNSSSAFSFSVAFNLTSPMVFQERTSWHPLLESSLALSNSSEAWLLSVLFWMDECFIAKTNESSNDESKEPSFWIWEIPLILRSLPGLIPVEFFLLKTSSGSDKNEEASFFDLEFSLNYIFSFKCFGSFLKFHLESKLRVLRFESAKPESLLFSSSFILASTGMRDFCLDTSIL